jgi:hypothetical protein
MKRTISILISVLVFLLFSFEIYGQAFEGWHYPLYLSNMSYWHSRIPVVVKNYSDRDASGESLMMKIGQEEGLLNLVGENASALRVVDSAGIELLWRITSPDKKIITDGIIPNGSEFTLPVTVKSGKSEIYYIYYDNPAAWPTGQVLDEKWRKRIMGQNDTGPNIEYLQWIIKPVQTVLLKEAGKNENWPDGEKWDIRVPIKRFNFENNTNERQLPVYVNMEQVFLRLHGKVDQNTPIQIGRSGINQYFRFENALVFDSRESPLSEQTTYAYFAGKDKQVVKNSLLDFSAWYNDKRNLVKNPGILQGENNWERIKSVAFPGKSVQDITKNGETGGQSLMLSNSAGNKKDEIGWMQSITVKPGHVYMYGAMVKCADISEGISIKMAFKRDNRDSLSREIRSDKINGTKDWTVISGIFTAPQDTVEARMSLVLSEPGTAWFKGMFVMEVVEGYSGSMFFEQREAMELEKLTAWPVNAIVKVFYEDLPPEKIGLARITAAGNETEPLQIALRSPLDCRNMKVVVSSPEDKNGKKLDQLTTCVVGYVPIDYPSNYYEKKVPYWYLKYPAESIGSDGWSGFWPDPLLPHNTFNLDANKTQPIWIEVTVPEGTKGGDYYGIIRIFKEDTIVKEIPWTVHVWNFSLPQKNTFGAVYDIRSERDMPEPLPDLTHNIVSKSDLQKMTLSIMAKHRISSGEITPVPKVNLKDGRADIDFSEYDKAAAYYFDELKNPYAYLPNGLFYLFGWAFPPSDKYNEKPYPGEYPYKDADRAKLRPEYKKAYQLVLKTFWDHLKEKGWADRFLLYLSDEPHEADNNNGKSNDITIQMKALCEMIHEVDPKIPIYVSTWWYRPEWQGYIDVWGLGYNGEGDYGNYVTAEDMQHITQSGGRIWYTTDGNFCTETPYMALERLMPWFGFKYGAEAYEFWGVNWLTYNPYKYGWHSYIFESQAPGEESWKRYPNGDGFIIYPGKPIGQNEPVASIRLKQVREGAEDYEYLALLSRLIKQSESKGQQTETAKNALQQAINLVNIPCAMGRYSTKILKSPDEVLRIREQVGESIEELIIK